jgi:hypothetical protein
MPSTPHLVPFDAHNPAAGLGSKKPVEMLLGGLVTRRMRVAAREVVFVKGVIEASEGVAVVFADHGGDLTVATLPSQKDELDRILQDLQTETGALLDLPRA